MPFYNIAFHLLLRYDSSEVHQSVRGELPVLELPLEDEPPTRPLHQSPELLAESLLSAEDAGSSGTSGSGSGARADGDADAAVDLDGRARCGVLPNDGTGGLVAVLLGGAAEAQLILHQQGAGVVHAGKAHQRRHLGRGADLRAADVDHDRGARRHLTARGGVGADD